MSEKGKTYLPRMKQLINDKVSVAYYLKQNVVSIVVP